MNRKPIYHLQKTKKSYDERQVLNIESLQVFEHEILGIIGPSGSGKSTLLRLLNFLEHPNEGRIDYKGKGFDAYTDIPLAYRREVTMVFQRPMLLDRNVFDNIKYGLQLRGQRNGKTLALEALHNVGLDGFSRQRARTLSGGEAQRVALARAMVIKPQVLLLDEPTANLDPYNVRMIEDIVINLNRESGVTLVLVTHNIFQARRLANRVAFMLEGHVIEVGETESIFESPMDPRTKSFINGEMIY
jgi:tungstate transport system ATP-binding protein